MKYDKLVYVIKSRLDSLGRDYDYDECVKNLINLDITGMPGLI